MTICTFIYQDGKRCDQQATHQLFLNVKPAFNGKMCQQHAEMIVDEYAPFAERGHIWTMEPIAQ